MAEEIKSIRLSKAAREFNISISTAVDFLAKKGLEIDSNPNTKLSEQESGLLRKEFQSEKDIMEKAKNINISIQAKKAALDEDALLEDGIVAKPESSKEDVKIEEEEEERDLLIKANSVTPSFKKEEKAKPKTTEASEKKEDTLAKSEKSEEVLMSAKDIEVVEKAKDDAVQDTIENTEEKIVKKSKTTKEVATIVEKKEDITEDVTKIEEKVEESLKKDKKTKTESTKTEKTLTEVEPKEAKIIKDNKADKENSTSVVIEDDKLEKASLENIGSAEKINEEFINAEPIVIENASNEKVIKDNKKKAESKETKENNSKKSTKIKDKVEENNAEQDTTVNDKLSPHHIKGPTVIKTIDLDELKRPKTPAKTKKEEVETEETKTEEVKTEEAKKTLESGDKVDINFIATNYIRLDGPKLTGAKIDLSQFNKKPKPVANSREGGNNQNASGTNKRKRKRIDNPNNASKPGTNAPNANKTQNNNQQSGTANKNKPWPKKDNNKKDNKKKHVAPVIDNQEIEKQIKETLARLNPLRKSKASKHRREKRQSISTSMEAEHERILEDLKTIKVTEFVTVNELATMMDIPVTNIISTCMSIGLFVSINQRLTADPILLLAEEFGYKVEFVDAEVLDNLSSAEEERSADEEVGRPPIVTVMGHVDHGKTSLLDYIRKTNVIAGEAGGITQHIGAYEVTLEDDKKITFLDTPGHEAFTAMRARGAKATDIAIIVVAADDKIMPQTIEAINHAQAAGVPLIFAINKIDKAGADPERIKGELAKMNLLVEDWGGKYQSQDISAKQGLNIELLLEKVLLEAELLDLKANPLKRAKGTVIESSLDKGRGYVAKVLVQDGSVSVGDSIIAGATYGRVKAMYNERNQAIAKAGPSTPVLLLGLNGAPQAGDSFNVTANEKEAKDITTRRVQLLREQGLRTQKHVTLDEIGRRIAIGDFKELNIIVKGDVDGSIEALSDSLLKLSSEEVQVNVIHKSVGQISESDVLLASASEAIIIGFQVRPSVAARKLAENEQIDIRLYSIIYDAINELKDAIEGMLSPEIQEKIVANLEVREIFKIHKVGTIAGCIVLDGKMGRNTKIRIIRNGIVVFTGKLGSLKRFKDEVKEVYLGQDCGLNIENFNDVKMGDIIEGYEETEVKRTL